MVHNIYGIPPPPQEDHHEAIDYLNTIVQGMQNQMYDIEVLAQANSVLTSSNSAVMAQLAQMTETMNAIQAQLNTLSATSTYSTIPKIKYHCWSCGRNFTHGRKALYSNKSGIQYEDYYKKILGGIKRGCVLRLVDIMNKIKIGTLKIGLINNIPNSNIKSTLAIADSGKNIHISNQATTTVYPVMMPKYMTARLLDGITMESSHVAKLQLPGLRKKAIQIHIFPKMRTAPLILLGVLCDDKCTITLYQQ